MGLGLIAATSKADGEGKAIRAGGCASVALLHSSRPIRPFAWPSGDVVRVIGGLHLILRQPDPAPHGNSCFVDGGPRSGNEWMPPGEMSAFRDKPVGAGWRKPAQRADLGWREPDAITHLPQAPRIVLAPAAERVEKLARNVGKVHGSARLVLELHEAAAAAAVAEALPFHRVELFKRLLLPKAGLGPRLWIRAGAGSFALRRLDHGRFVPEFLSRELGHGLHPR